MAVQQGAARIPAQLRPDRNLSTVTVHVRRLREKIEPDPAQPVFLVTVWGVGYRVDLSGRGGH